MSVSLAISSFYITYVFLLTTGVITFIEALRSPVPQIRHIMNLETCISIVASYFYGLFIEEINKAQNLYNVKDDNKDNNNNIIDNIIDNIANTDSAIIKPLSVIPIEKINNMRYIDWSITTPFMLLVLSMVLGYENKVIVKFTPFVLTMFLNFAMLAFGYSGEIGLLNKNIAGFMGFIFFFLTYGAIWKLFMTGSKITVQSKFIFWIFLGTWSLYGLFYYTNEATKLIGYNILDLIAKAFVGIFFWLYLTKSVVF
jgi:bacteriorhodopsin